MTVRNIKNITPIKIKDPTYVDLYSPWDLKKIGKVECISKKEVDQILDVSSNAFKNNKKYLSKIKRLEILKNCRNKLLKNSRKFTNIIALEGGKPLKDSKIEVERAVNGLELCAEALKKSHGTEIPMNINKASVNKIAFTRKFPVGPVLAISAFNHPLNLVIHQIGPAIAAGCPIIIKPSLETPVSCYEFIKLLLESGLPKEFCQMINIKNHIITQKFVKDPRISFLSFIGSSDVGWKLKTMMPPGAKCAMEHGGVGSVIIDKDADIQKILPSILRGAFYHAGQVCVSIQKVIIHEDLIDEFTELTKKSILKIKVGDPRKITTDVGPLIRPSEVKRIDKVIKKSISEGAELICGGFAKNETTYECTVLKNPKENSTVSSHEIFGPVLCLYSFNTIDEAIQKANHDKFAFQSSVYTKNIDTAILCYENLDAKSVFINEQTAFRVDWMPFGGIKHSGEAVGGIEYSFSDLLYDKLIIINSNNITL